MTAFDDLRRMVRVALRFVALALPLGASVGAQAQTVHGDVQVETSGGYARVVLKLAEEVEADVRSAGNIIVVSFKRPVDVGIEKLQIAIPSYVGAARRDPDGRGFRIALARKATVNSMAAGERLFIDLLPDTWTGLAPGLPKDVIEQLSRRAREAERALRNQRQVSAKNERLARVRVATQPSFTRYVFELPEVVAVTSDRGAEELTLVFAARLKFDFGEIKTSLPSTVKAIESYEQNDGVSVRFALTGKADVRMFREDRNYVVDIGAADAKDAVAAPPRVDDLAKFVSEQPQKPGTQSAPIAGIEAPQSPPLAAAQQPAAKPQPEAPKPAAERPQVDIQKVEIQKPEPAKPQAEKPAGASAPVTARPASVSESLEPRPDTRVAAPAIENSQQKGKNVTADVRRQGDSLVLSFPFGAPTPAAIFRRAGTLWLVFDHRGEIDLGALGGQSGNFIRYAQAMALPDGQVIRLMLDRPRLVSASTESGNWVVTIGDNVAEPTNPLSVSRTTTNDARPAIMVPIDQPRELRRIADPDMGDNLLVVTALGPTRGFIRPLDFVEFRALASTHGIAIQPLADDLQVELSAERATIVRPGGLALSGGLTASRSAAAASRPVIFDPELWGFDRQSAFSERQYKMIAAAADANETKRMAPRLDLARFYLARDMYAEAKGVLDVSLGDERPNADNPSGLVLRAIALIMLNRPDEALKDLNHPLLGDTLDAPLWRAFANSRLGKWDEARRGFKNVEAAIAMQPLELQRIALRESLRTAIEIRDYATAQNLLNEFDSVGRPPDIQPSLAVLQGRLLQGLGKTQDAMRNFRIAAESDDRPSSAQGQLRNLSLRYELGDLKRPDMIGELETLTTVWRGDETEIESLHRLARLYTEERRFRDAFYVMRSALKAHPNSEMTRRIQDEAAVTFDSLFLAGKGDALPAIDALSLFYDFRELTPIGRRGDEMIRRLADRLVSVDLLPQAAELLQHQVDNRLQGAARAHVATRLAVIYLMDRKPDRAQSVLRATRMAELNTELRQLRLLLEARALSDIGRHDLALEVVGNIENREAVRLRADILWAARRHGEAAEQLEVLHAERWKDFAPLSDVERGDILRAAIGYALAGDTIGIGRLREKYESKMNESPEKRAFEIATAPHQAKSSEFSDLSKAVGANDTLDSFLRDMRGRYPEIGTLSPGETQPGLQKQSQQHTQRELADPVPTAAILKR
ncbi:MAG: tetratricopeptide repeat protein [Pseudorhodoplanes sp.]